MDWPISWNKVKSQLSVAPPLYLKEPVNITWDGVVKEENVVDQAGYKLSATPLSVEELDGATMTCLYANREFTGVCHVCTDISGNELAGLQAPFFVAYEGVPNAYLIAAKPFSDGGMAQVGINALCDVDVDGDGSFIIPSGLYTVATPSDESGQLISIQSNTPIVQISNPYKDFFAAMPHGVYNVTIDNLVATPEGTEITDTDLIAQLNKLPKQAGFLMNVSIPATNAAFSAYPSFFKEGEAYAYVITLVDSSVFVFSNENGVWKLSK